MLKKIFETGKRFFFKIAGDNISTYSAQASFFIILSVFPFIMLLLTSIKYTKISKALLLSLALKIMPDPIDPLIVSIIDELYRNAGSALVSISVILAIWSASKGVLSMIRGLNNIYHFDDKRNYFVIRFLSAVYTLIFLVAIVVSLLLLVFGRSIYARIEETSFTLYGLIGFFLRQRLIISIIILTFLFLVIYRVLPSQKYSFKSLLPGALFSALGWIISSYLFSIYFKYFPNSYTYGSLSTFIILMLWIYAGMYILFIGAEINLYFRIQYENLLRRIANKH
jgi:membrane protein